jgi:hypothetical protein
MTECDEVAESIFSTLAEPIRTYADAERIAAERLREESQTVRDNVAESLWQRAQRADLSPFCKVCGWRKGGRDSWNGKACKCGHSAPPMERVS